MKMDDHDGSQPQDGAFADVEKAEFLRQQINAFATGAVKYGSVDRDWTNQRLNRLGAPLVTGQAKYQINVPIEGSYGTTVVAGSRAEALEKFTAYVVAIQAAGEMRSRHCGEGVYDITVTGGDPVFYSGPEDVVLDESTPPPALPQLRDGIRQMLKDGIATQGWDRGYAEQAIDAMGLDPLPAAHFKTVSVPVSGTTELSVLVFDDEDDDVVQDKVATIMGRAKDVLVAPEEMGTASWARPTGDVGFTLLKDDDDE